MRYPSKSRKKCTIYHTFLPDFRKFPDFPGAARSPHHSGEPGRHPGWLQLDEKCYSEKKSRSKKNSAIFFVENKKKFDFLGFFKNRGEKKIENPKFSIFGRNFRNFDFFEKNLEKKWVFSKKFFPTFLKKFSIFFDVFFP